MIPALKPKQKFHIQRSAKYSTRGKRTYRIMVDIQNALSEMTKKNNEAIGSIRVLLPRNMTQVV
jgi:hypothetical protein